MISIVSYGMGNICSIRNAFRYWQKEVEVISTPREIEKSTHLVLPGVGSFREAMLQIKKYDLVSALYTAAKDEKKPVLGICLGMQIMASEGYEDGWSQGLGWIEGEVVPLVEGHSNFSVPHVGFNSVSNQALPDKCSILGENILQDYYFCHSYKLVSNSQDFTYGISRYENEFIACIQNDNIWGTQFHPEKSQSNGLIALKRFCDLVVNHG